MNLNKWLFGAAALLLGACSENFDDGPNAGNATEEGQGYIGINIQLPTTSGTRANDDFDDGELSEYQVYDAVLVLFKGTNAATATCTGAFFLQEAEPSFEDVDQITRSSIRVANVTGVDFNNRLFALVVANGMNRVYNMDKACPDWMKDKTIKDFQEKVESLKFVEQETPGRGTASNIFMTNSPLSEVVGGVSRPTDITDDVLPVLVELNPKVYRLQSDAIANPAGIIHIERIVAKVTCSRFPTTTDITVNIGGFPYKLEIDKVWWDMAQDMKDTYFVRNTDADWDWDLATTLDMPNITLGKYRMIGGNAIASKKLVEQTVDDETQKVLVDQAYYRPYFCKVPGYGESEETGDDKTLESKNFNKTVMEFTNQTVAWTGTTHEGAFYPLENTFPVDFMKYGNTTRVGFWVTFKFVPQPNEEGKSGPVLNIKDQDFYINGLDKTVLYLKEDGKDPFTNRVLAELTKKSESIVDSETDKDDGTKISYVGSKVIIESEDENGKHSIEYDRMKYEAMWEAILYALDRTKDGSINLNLYDLIDITYKDTDDGSLAIQSIQFKSKDQINAILDSGSVPFDKEIVYTFDDNTITLLNNLGYFTKYDAGRAFYEVRIKHFGDDLTPWYGDNKPSATTIEESYGDDIPGVSDADQAARNNNYLGRYGVVRNNWYDIVVKSIVRLGDAKDPAKWDANWKNKPDDNKDQYIAVELRVLSWAKRSQDVEF